MLLFCVSNGTDWQRAGVTGETVTALIVRGLLVRDSGGRLTLTESGCSTFTLGADGLSWKTTRRLRRMLRSRALSAKRGLLKNAT